MCLFFLFIYWTSHSSATEGYKSLPPGRKTSRWNHLAFFHFQSAMVMCRYNQLVNSSRNNATECPDWNLNLDKLMFWSSVQVSDLHQTNKNALIAQGQERVRHRCHHKVLCVQIDCGFWLSGHLWSLLVLSWASWMNEWMHEGACIECHTTLHMAQSHSSRCWSDAPAAESRSPLVPAGPSSTAVAAHSSDQKSGFLSYHSTERGTGRGSH